MKKLAVATDVVAENLLAIIGTKPLPRPVRLAVLAEVRKLQGIADALALSH